MVPRLRIFDTYGDGREELAVGRPRGCVLLVWVGLWDGYVKCGCVIFLSVCTYATSPILVICSILQSATKYSYSPHSQPNIQPHLALRFFEFGCVDGLCVFA
jgi:hypothetical protein